MADITTTWPGHEFCSWSVERPIGGGPISVGHAGCECGVEHPWQGRDEAHQRHVIEVVAAAAREDRDTTWKIAVTTLMNALDVNGYDGATVLPDLLAATREEAATTERDRVLALVEAAVTPWTETARDNLLAAIKEARRCVITAQEESPHG